MSTSSGRGSTGWPIRLLCARVRSPVVIAGSRRDRRAPVCSELSGGRTLCERAEIRAAIGAMRRASTSQPLNRASRRWQQWLVPKGPVSGPSWERASRSASPSVPQRLDRASRPSQQRFVPKGPVSGPFGSRAAIRVAIGADPVSEHIAAPQSIFAAIAASVLACTAHVTPEARRAGLRDAAVSPRPARTTDPWGPFFSPQRCSPRRRKQR